MEVATTIAEALRVMGTTSIMDAAQNAQRKARYRFDTVVVWREVGAGREVSFGLRGYCWSVFAEPSVWVSEAADAALKEQRGLQKQGAVSGKRAADVLSSLTFLCGTPLEARNPATWQECLVVSKVGSESPSTVNFLCWPNVAKENEFRLGKMGDLRTAIRKHGFGIGS